MKKNCKICKKNSDKAFDVQDNLGKIKIVSTQHLQLPHPVEHVVINLPNINSFGSVMKYINHLSLMPDLSTIIKAKFLTCILSTCIKRKPHQNIA